MTTLASAGTRLRAQPYLMSPRSASATSWWQSLWSRRNGRMQDIRQLMVAQLATVEDGFVRRDLADKISTAAHPNDLWALREELRDALVPAHGELLARQRLTDISFMFAGLLEGRPAHRYAGVHRSPAEESACMTP